MKSKPDVEGHSHHTVDPRVHIGHVHLKAPTSSAPYLFIRAY